MDRLTFNGLLLAFFVICDVITWSEDYKNFYIKNSITSQDIEGTGFSIIKRAQTI